MNIKVKKIIAREGLTLFLFIFVSFFIYQFSGIIAELYVKIRYSYIAKSETILLLNLHSYVVHRVEILSYLLYPLHWIIRFVPWAIKTLRSK